MIVISVERRLIYCGRCRGATHGTLKERLGAFLGGAFVGAEICMVALDTPITWQVPITFYLARMARVAGFRLARFALRSNDGVHLRLWQIRNGPVGRTSHIGW